MFPTLLSLGPITIHSYGLMFAIGFLVALWGMRRDGSKAGIDPDLIADASFWTLLVGLAGTRILHIIMYREQYSLYDPIGWVAIWRGGLVFQGAILPIYVFLLIYLRKRGLSFCKTLDVVCPWMALCHGLGRMGCFLNGCCYGSLTESVLGMRFPRIPWDTQQTVTGSPAYVEHMEQNLVNPMADHWSCPVYPTQLMEFAVLIALFFILKLLLRYWRPYDGFVVCMYLILYATARFFIEFLRGDHNPILFASLSAQQIFCILAVVVATVFALGLWLRAYLLQEDAALPRRTRGIRSDSSREVPRS